MMDQANAKRLTLNARGQCKSALVVVLDTRRDLEMTSRIL